MQTLDDISNAILNINPKMGLNMEFELDMEMENWNAHISQNSDFAPTTLPPPVLNCSTE